MTKIKKALVGIIMVIIAVLGVTTVSNATTYSDMKNKEIKEGDTFTISGSEYHNPENNIMCLENGAKAPSAESGPIRYSVDSIVEIKGSLARRLSDTNNVLKNVENQKMEYILKSTVSNDVKKWAIWMEANKWWTYVGNNLGFIIDPNLNDNWYYNGEKFSVFDQDSMKRYNEIFGMQGIGQWEAGKKLYDKACSLKDDGKTSWDEGKVIVVNNKKISVEMQDGNYVIGPFNWKYNGEIKEVSVQSDTGTSVKVDSFAQWKLNELVPCSSISSGDDFYMLIPSGALSSKITEVNVKINAPVSSTKMYFLNPQIHDYQSMMLYENGPDNEEINCPLDYGIPLLGDLKIKKVIKVNGKNTNTILNNVGFKIKGKNGYVAKKNGKIVDNASFEDATEFITGVNGEKENDGKIIIEDLPIGTYEAYEVKNPNYGYEIINNPITVEVKDKSRVEGSFTTVGNEKKFIKLSGYVWVDKSNGKSGGDTRNSFYKTVIDGIPDDKDQLLDGIKVKLNYKNGNTIETIETVTTSELKRYKGSRFDGHGEYLFDNVDIKNRELENYYIEFEYNGVTYENVVSYYNKGEIGEINDEPNGFLKGSDKSYKEGYVRSKFTSKAEEGAGTRTEFNQSFEIVEGTATKENGIATNKNRDKKWNLKYNFDPEQHKAIWSSPVNEYKITASTENAGYKIKDENFDYKQEEIKYINLGLHEREQPDLALLTDIQNVKLAINGYEHTYEYNNKIKKVEFNVGVKEAKEKDGTYSRAIYKSDYLYKNDNDNDKELKVYITYAIMIENQSTLNSKVNSIVDYYDKELKIEKVGTDLDNQGNVINLIEDKKEDENYNKNPDSKYHKITINTDTSIDPQTRQRICYIQFKLSRDQVARILDEKGTENNEQSILKNVAEINSYSSLKNGKPYAGIDTDSAPGNCIPGNETTYEDDTDDAPAFRLEVGAPREMLGKVFEDNAITENGENASEVMTGKERKGDGLYSEGENGIAEVEVTLQEQVEDGKEGKQYKTKTVAEDGWYKVVRPEEESENKVEDITLEKIDEQLEGETCVDLKKGDFYIENYIPGNYVLTYTWGDDTYTVQNYKGTIYKEKDNEEWYKSEDPRYSDAKDDWTVNTIRPDKMNSKTHMMAIGIEKDRDEGDVSYAITTITDGDSFVPKEYVIQNIDFGIVERARQEIGFSKKVSGVRLTLANGQTIIDATIDENGTISGDRKSLTYGPPANGDKGWVKAEIDNELIQGATLQIKYTIKVKNNSECDYNTQEYYWYGEVPADKENYVVKLKAEGVYDYLDREMALDTSKDNETWEVIDKQKYTETVQGDTRIEGIYKEWSTTPEYEKGTIITKYGFESPIIIEEMFEEWEEIITESKTTVRDVKLENKTILQNSQLEEKIGPGAENSVDLYVSKLLANTDEIDLNNEAEVTELHTTNIGGRIPYYNVYTFSEVGKITQPTGENQDYIVPIIVGTTAFMLLGAGIVIIKKKVL